VNIQEYISSGIVESYVLGLASDEERAEFERMCAAHAEVKAARDAFELALEEHSLANAVPPPRQVRSQVFAELQIEKEKHGFTGNNGIGEETPAPVVQMDPRWRYVAAASIVLLIASLIFNFYFFNKYKTFSDQYSALLAQNQEMARNERAIQTRLNDMQNAIDIFGDTAMAVIRMDATGVQTSPDPNSMATIYWDTRSKDVYLRVNRMPAATSEKQYQLWALVDGVPVDAGVFDVNNGVAILKMKNIPRAQAFAVTLEKRGGSEKPDLTQMYVLGKV
jgi:anti-sigma-K factor RskA